MSASPREVRDRLRDVENLAPMRGFNIAEAKVWLRNINGFSAKDLDDTDETTLLLLYRESLLEYETGFDR